MHSGVCSIKANVLFALNNTLLLSTLVLEIYITAELTHSNLTHCIQGVTSNVLNSSGAGLVTTAVKKSELAKKSHDLVILSMPFIIDYQ